MGVESQSGEEARIKEDPSDGIGHAARWLGCTREALEEALCNRTVKVSRSWQWGSAGLGWRYVVYICSVCIYM